ncbi:venom dipeptidyl peptidase 4 [Caerostris darwini]|uniref:Venom dipeptidyl peptidase 4 n=1 Tax=Caerostris darwini TaxID=1538125 RepID=A0AAV4TDC7_9ARAC|nr:venom dipeptidyl peptidase 4 [Caerostris darwini]
MGKEHLEAFAPNCNGAKCSFCLIYDQRPPSRKGWVDLYDPLVFGHGGKSWFMRLPLSQGLSGHYRHIAVAHNENAAKGIMFSSLRLGYRDLNPRIN